MHKKLLEPILGHIAEHKKEAIIDAIGYLEHNNPDVYEEFIKEFNKESISTDEEAHKYLKMVSKYLENKHIDKEYE